MKTPYDAARRLKRRELDDVRQALSEAEARLNAIVGAINDTEASVRRERAVAAEYPLINIGPFAAAKRGEIAALTRDMGMIETEIDALRDALMAKFEALKPLDFASEDYRLVKRREAGKRERVKLDEVAGRRHRLRSDFAD